MKLKVLLLDFGSTFIKYTIYEIESETEIFSDSVPFPGPMINDGVNYEVLEATIRRIVYQIFDIASEKECKNAFICVQMHGYLLRRCGNFGNYISWRDRRGDISDERLAKIDISENGTAVKKNLPLISILTYEKNFVEESEFFTLGSYISYLLTGRNITHKTDACASGFFNANTLEKNVFFEGLILPTALGEVEIIGKYRGICVYAPMGDHQISFLGSGAEEKNAYLLNIGTATQISVLAESKEPCENCEKRPYFSGKRLFTISGLTGGSSLFINGRAKIDKFLFEVCYAVSCLPKRKYMVVGGGGAEYVYHELASYLITKGILCEYSPNIVLGKEGLKKIANERCKA